MPYIRRIGSQTVILDDADADRILSQLARGVRTQIRGRAGGPVSCFQTYYGIWQRHDRYHSVNLFLWTVEALGGAELPSSSYVNRIRSMNRTLNSSLTPRRIGRFFDLFPEYNWRQGRFVRDMRLFLDRVIGGTGMGRTMAGERVTYSETGDEIVRDAVNALTGAGLGQVIGHFLEPLTGNLTTLALREIERGSLMRGMSIALSDAQLGNAIADAIQRMFREAVEPLRRALSRCSPSGGARAYAREMSEALMQDRNFRRILQEEIEASA